MFVHSTVQPVMTRLWLMILAISLIVTMVSFATPGLASAEWYCGSWSDTGNWRVASCQGGICVWPSGTNYATLEKEQVRQCCDAYQCWNVYQWVVYYNGCTYC